MPRLLYVLPAFLIIISSLIIITLSTQVVPRERDNTRAPQTTTDQWQPYTSSGLGISFSYPPVLSVTEYSGAVTLSHSLPLSHPNPCDFVGNNPQPLPRFTDFNVVVEVSPTNLITTIRTKEGDLLDEYISQSTLLTPPGFIDQVNFGQLTGYKIFRGVEGCGNHIYYLSSSSTQTLVVRRDTIPEFSGGVSNPERYLDLPGVISPSQEEQIITRILSTFKFLDQDQAGASNWKTYANSKYGYSFNYPDTWGIGTQCTGDSQTGLVRLGPNLLKFPSSDCGTANIPSAIMFYIGDAPPSPSSNTQIVSQKTLVVDNTPGQYSEFSPTSLQFFIPLNQQYLIIETGSYPLPSLKNYFDTILSTFKFI